jgi:hypothetical protein
MAILRGHVRHHDKILRMAGFIADPVLIFGWHEMELGQESLIAANPSGIARKLRTFMRHSDKIGLLKKKLREEQTVQTQRVLPREFQCETFVDVVKRFGANEVTVMDLFDSRAEIKFDMNKPVPPEFHDRFGTFIDIGCLEHVFDTAQCLENCMRMTRLHGHYLLHIPVNGYFNHGIHVFNPDIIALAFTVNGFTVLSTHYSDESGKDLADPSAPTDVLLWLVARKDRAMGEFVAPQQGTWEATYSSPYVMGA